MYASQNNINDLHICQQTLYELRVLGVFQSIPSKSKFRMLHWPIADSAPGIRNKTVIFQILICNIGNID